MRLVSITANRHIFDGKVNGSPLRLLLAFDDGRQLRLRGAADGEGMILDGLSTSPATWRNMAGRISPT